MKRIAFFAVMTLAAATLAFSGGEEEAAGDEMSTEAAPVVMFEDSESVTEAGVTVQWRVEGDNLTVVMSAETEGWVSVGFDPSRQMADANIIIGYVDDGEVFVRDDYGTGSVRHGADVENGGVDNLSNVQGSEAGGVTTIRFTIPLDSGDSMDKPLEVGSSYTVIVAYGPNRADDFGSYHSSRGSFEMQL